MLTSQSCEVAVQFTLHDSPSGFVWSPNLKIDTGNDVTACAAGQDCFPSEVRKRQVVQVVWSRKKRNETRGAAPVLFHISFLTATLPHPGSARPDIEDNFSGVREFIGELSDSILEQFTHGDQNGNFCERRANAYLPPISGLLLTIGKIGDRSLPLTSS